MGSQRVIQLDLTRQQLLIKPDDPLPRFHPPPKAIMITPIYNYDAQLGDPRYAYAYGANGSSHLRDSLPHLRHSSAYEPSYIHYPRDSYGPEYHRDHIPYSRSPSIDGRRRSYDSRSSSSSNDRHDRAVYSDDDYSSPPERRRRRRASSYTPPRRHNRRHEARTPSTERNSYHSRRHDDHAGRDSYQYDSEDDYSHRYSSYPHSYNQTRTRERPSDDPIARHPADYQVQATHQQTRTRERPSNDPIAQHPPDYQVQATHHQGQGQATSDRRPTGYRPLALSAQSDIASYGESSAPQHGRPPTSASLYAGRSPFYPPGDDSASHLGFMHSPAATGVQTAPTNASALSLHGKFLHHKQVLDNIVKDYLKLLPPHPEWQPSKLSGKRKAVCIGINYVGQAKALKGCFNDAKSMREFLITQYHFPQDQILLLTDADPSFTRPTREEIFKAFMWLVKDAKTHDSLFLHYSGHGGQSKDAGGREKDGMDETIFPVDFKKAGDIIDDELHQALVEPLPAGCRLTALFDSCHSGTVLDLPYLFSSHGRLRGLEHITARAKKRGMGSKSDVICFAACKDDETSADTFEGGVAVGAMSHAFLQTLERNRQLKYDDLLAQMRAILVPKYHQKPQISGTNPLDLDQVFSL